jgi:hypothetical protein
VVIYDNDPANIVRIYNRNKTVVIQSGGNWNGADVKVMNAMGQILYSARHFNQSSIELKTTGTGLYIVTLQKGNKVETKKLLVL